MEYVVIYKMPWGEYKLRSPQRFTYQQAKAFAKEVNGLVIHETSIDCLDLL